MHILCTERHCYQNVFKTKDLKFTQKKSFRAYRQYSKKSEILFNENGWDFLEWRCLAQKYIKTGRRVGMI